jgi:ubiquinone/menaquinone biosynthesis C-methylase UbiE
MVGSTDTSYTLALTNDELQRYRRSAAWARASEQAAWLAAGVRPGARVADIGCGPAAILTELAQLVSPGGSVDGVDRDARARATAAQVISSAGVENVRIVAGEADATGLEEGTYDTVMMRHVLFHNGARVPAILGHLARLLRPGGHLYLVEVDFLARRLVPVDAELEELTTAFVKLAAGRGSDLQIGPHLGHLLLDAGLELISFDARYQIYSGEVARTTRGPEWAAREALTAAGLATEADFDRWEQAWARRVADPTPKFSFVPMFQAVGRRSE